MAVAYVRDHAEMSIKVAATNNATVGIGATPNDVDGLLVARIIFDNFTTASQPVVSSIAKMAGETNNWVFLGAARSTSTSGGAFASGEMWCIKTTVQWTASSTYVVTLSNSVTMKATQVREFSGVEAALRGAAGTAYSTTTTAASATTSGTAPQIGDLALGFAFASNTVTALGGDTDSTGGSWSAVNGFGSTGGNATTNNTGTSQYKIVTSTSAQTYNISSGATAGNGSIVAILQQTPPPQILPDRIRQPVGAGTARGAAVHMEAMRRALQ